MTDNTDDVKLKELRLLLPENVVDLIDKLVCGEFFNQQGYQYTGKRKEMRTQLIIQAVINLAHSQNNEIYLDSCGIEEGDAIEIKERFKFHAPGNDIS